ncbi:MAG: GGDEF and EAL domain-containing protein [Gammaproteobacteria bacterium]|nr:MAG: GGDEF and EAL domain-containing protein [Gammaproteobacteria bacterium]
MLKSDRKRILIIDDNPAVHDDYRKVLHTQEKKITAEFAIISRSTQPAYIIDSAYQGKSALEMVRDSLKTYQPYSLAFVDIRMPPGKDGIWTIKKMWEIDPDIQVVICTAYSDYGWEEISQELNKSDNLFILKKPFEMIEIRQLAAALTQKWELHQQVQCDMENLEHLLNARTADLKKSAGQLLIQTTQDKLTGLPNRILLIDRLQQAITHAEHNGSMVGLLFIDINNFQQINDSFSYNTGDLLLKKIAQKFRSLLNETMTIARWESDNFVVVVPALSQEKDLIVLAKELIEKSMSSYAIENQLITLTSNIGISIYPLHAHDANSLLTNASSALHAAKKQGHGIYQVYHKQFHTHVLKKVKIENALHNAIKKNEFTLYYQPIMELHNNKITGVETLLRWINPTLGNVSPHEFIPIAEETGLIIPINNWVIRQAILQLKQWIQQDIPYLRIAVNISGQQFQQANFIETIEELLVETQINSALIELELTENSILGILSDIKMKMIELKNMGIHLVMDDFGVGHASLSYLKQFPFEKIKIDKSFIQGLDERAEDAVIINTMIRVIKNMNREIVIKGIETYGQLDFLRHYGGDKVQGYIFHRPLNSEKCLQVLKSQVARKFDIIK